MAGKAQIVRTGSMGLFLLILLNLTGTNCNNSKRTELVDIRFVLDISVYPEEGKFQVHDTIWIELNMSDSMHEYNSGKRMKYVNPNLGTTLILQKLVDPNKVIQEQPGGVSDFEAITLIGQFIEPSGRFANLKFNYEDAFYKYWMGLIPDKPGIYSIRFLGPDILDMNGLSLPYNDPDVKYIPVYQFFYHVVNGGLNNNLELLRANTKLLSDDYPTTDNIYAEQKGSFTFQVVE